MLSLNPELGGIYDRIQALILSCTLTITKLHPVDFSRCRLLPLGKLIIVILSVVSGGRDKGIQTKLEEFFTAVRRSQVWANAQSPHRSAFTKARAKISWEAFKTLFQQFVNLAHECFPDREEYRWQGFSVYAFDGSKYNLPATTDIRAEFDPDSGLDKPGKGHYPQALITTVYDVFRRLPIARTVCPIAQGDERAQAMQLFASVPPSSVSLFDRGFPSYGFLDFLNRQSDRYYVVRCPGQSTFAAVEAFVSRGEAEAILYLLPSNEFKRHITRAERKTLAPIRVRAIRLEHPDGTVSVLLTNLFDPVQFPCSALISLYYRRWAIENHYRDEKTLQHIETFHARTPNGIRQELFAILIVCVIARLLTALSVSSESVETENCVVQPQIKNAIMAVAREAALLLPDDPEQAFVLFQELLDAIRKVKYYKPKKTRPPAPRINKRPVNKWKTHRKKQEQLRDVA